MKILILTQFFPPEMGAPQTRLAEFSKNLTKLGHEVEVITAMPNYPTGRIFEQYRGKLYSKELFHNIPVHRLWVYAALGKSVQRLLSYLSFTFMAFFGVFFCKKPDYIFINSGPLFLSITGKFYSLFWQKPVIFNVADLWPRSVEKLGAAGGASVFLKLALSLEAWSYRNAKFVTAVTEGIKTVLLDEKKLDPKKVLFLPNGVNTDLYNSPSNPQKASELRKKLGLTEKFVLIYSGNHGFAHALDNVLHAAKICAEQQKNDATWAKLHFLFIGDGSDKERLVNLKNNLKLDNVTFLPPVSQEELVHYLEFADVGLINIKNSHLAAETRPAKMFPMMSMKKPILYAGFGEGAEIIKKCNGGIVVSAENPEELASAAKNMNSNIALLSEYGNNNRKFVEENLKFIHLVEKWLNELQVKSN